MLAFLHRNLKEADSSIYISKDRQLVNSRKVLESKARILCEQGHGKRLKRPKHWRPKTKSNCGPNQSLKSLIATMWFLLAQVYEAAKSTTTCLSKIFALTKTTMASSTSRRKKILQKLAKADFEKKDESFS